MVKKPICSRFERMPEWKVILPGKLEATSDCVFMTVFGRRGRLDEDMENDSPLPFSESGVGLPRPGLGRATIPDACRRQLEACPAWAAI